MEEEKARLRELEDLKRHLDSETEDFQNQVKYRVHEAPISYISHSGQQQKRGKVSSSNSLMGDADWVAMVLALTVIIGVQLV